MVIHSKYLDYVAAAQSKTHSDQDPVPNWPRPLSECFNFPKLSHTHKATVDVRYVPKCIHLNAANEYGAGHREGGRYMRAPAEPEIVDQLKTSYYTMKPVKHTHDFVERMVKGLPLAFRVERPEDLEWHAGGHGNGWNLGSFHVLGINRQSNTLYFFTASWDYTL